MPRLVRRRPLAERIAAYLNPLDFWLWLSEEFETREWDTKGVANPVGLALNFVLLIARANSGGSSSKDVDDVFGDTRGPGWLSWFATFTVHLLTWFSVANAVYTFLRKRHYRLFETSVEVAPGTPSAKRVRVDSSPVSSSPLRLFTEMIADTSVESRLHPDPTRDVWELAVWDPLPACLRLFCLFSPGHVLVYRLFLPVLPSDPRPSTTVMTTLFLQVLLSAQLLLLQSSFSQQTKDTAVIHKEVFNEYDTKFVHPRLNPVVRDVSTQFTGPDSTFSSKDGVQTYTPTTIIRREFKTNPNPNYAKHIDPDNTGIISQREFLTPNPSLKTPSTFSQSTSFSRRESSPLRQATMRQPQFRQSTSTSTGDGGSLGVYSHANSPLKKASSMHDMKGGRKEMPKNSFQAAQREIMEERERERERSTSPMKKLRASENESARKRTSLPSGFGGQPSQFGPGSLNEYRKWGPNF